MMITRDDAIEVLSELISSGILAEDIEYKLQDIMSCIEAECIGRHEWGVPRDELAKLYTAIRSDLITDEDMKEYERIHRKVTFIPSVKERIIIETMVCERIEDSTGEEASGEDIERWFKRF